MKVEIAVQEMNCLFVQVLLNEIKALINLGLKLRCRLFDSAFSYFRSCKVSRVGLYYIIRHDGMVLIMPQV